MSIPDELMIRYFELVTKVEVDEIRKLEKGLAEGLIHPRDLKMKLGWEIVRIYHGEEEANQAKDEFSKMFQKKEAPDEMPEFRLNDLGAENDGSIELVTLMVNASLAPSKGEARRLVQQGGVKLNDQKITDPQAVVSPSAGDIIKVGKRKFIRVVP
jgi:tyrosyl-tRNA synthetase